MSNLGSKGKWSRLLGGRTKDILLFGVLALILFYATWKIFRGGGGEKESSFDYSENEIKVMRLLEEIDGVGEVSVIVYEQGKEVQSVVVVCAGANDLRVVMNVREAVSAALGTEQNTVKIYLKKD